LVISLVVSSLAMVGFYNASGLAIPPLWIATVFAMLATNVLFKALGAEPFPTSYRSTASRSVRKLR
jgi:hypothetical protein